MNIDPNLLTTALTSAAVGAIVAAVIGQIGQYFDRAQKKELADMELKKLLFTKAVDVAMADHDLMLELAKLRGGGFIPPAAVTVTKQFEYMKHIYEEGNVPDEVLKLIQEQIDELNKRP